MWGVHTAVIVLGTVLVTCSVACRKWCKGLFLSVVCHWRVVPQAKVAHGVGVPLARCFYCCWALRSQPFGPWA
jgi:hypothetical protein